MIEITAALTGARAFLQMASDALGARDDAKVRTALVELQGKLFDATSAALAMAEKAAALQAALSAAEREKAELQKKIDERSGYTLHKLPSGSFVYASQGSDEVGASPAHYLCQPCYDKGVKAILQPSQYIYGGHYWSCPEGGNTHDVS